jgi:hypothetical protein
MQPPRPADTQMREWCNSQHPINRNTLGDLDESLWPDGKDP